MDQPANEPTQGDGSASKLGALYDIGLNYYRAREYRKAIECWEGALAFDENNFRALTYISLAYEELNENNASREALLRALEIQPAYAKAWNNLGNNYRRSGELFRAVEAYEKALELSKRSPDYRYNLAITYLDTLQYKKALRQLLKYHKLRPQDTAILAPLTTAYYHTGNPGPALACIRSYLKVNPTTSRFARLRAQMKILRSDLEQQERDREAAAAERALLEDSGELPAVEDDSMMLLVIDPDPAPDAPGKGNDDSQVAAALE